MERIKQIAKLVPSNSTIIDIGCDHGYLGIELINQNRNINVISSDISNNALLMAKKNIIANNMQDLIELRCGNGLDVISDNEVDVVVMSGLGAHTELEILINNKEKLNSISTIILSPNDKPCLIRKKLDLINYHIMDEDVVFENEKYYEILVLKKNKIVYSYEDILLGPILCTKKNVKQYYEYLYTKNKKIYDNLPLSYIDKRKEILKKLDLYKKHI